MCKQACGVSYPDNNVLVPLSCAARFPLLHVKKCFGAAKVFAKILSKFLVIKISSVTRNFLVSLEINF